MYFSGLGAVQAPTQAALNKAAQQKAIDQIKQAQEAQRAAILSVAGQNDLDDQRYATLQSRMIYGGVALAAIILIGFMLLRKKD